MGAFGAPAYFGVLGTLTATLTLFDLWRKLRQRPVPRSQKGPFVNTRELVASTDLSTSRVPGATSPERSADGNSSPR
jgi:hypothetical protein